MKFLPYAKQFIDKSDIDCLKKALTSPSITRGPITETFEKECASYLGAQYAVSFNSGTQALTAAYYAADLSAEDQLISSPNTFVGTVAGALQKTSQLLLADINTQTGSPQFEQVSMQPNKRLFITPVHYAGIAQIVEKPFKNTVVIEDACEAFGSSYLDGKMVGSCPKSDMSVFSFHPAKTICCAEGGLVTTNHKGFYEKLKLFRNNGIVKQEDDLLWHYDIVDTTTNAHMTELQAALGLSQLQKIDRMLSQKRNLVSVYREILTENPLFSFLDETYDPFSAHNLFTVMIDFEKTETDKNTLMKNLRNEGIYTQVHFIPLYHHTYFKKNFNFKKEDFPETEAYFKKALTLPLFFEMTSDDVQRVCVALCKHLKVLSYC